MKRQLEDQPIETLLTLAARGDRAAAVELEERDLCPPVCLTDAERATLFLGIPTSDTVRVSAASRINGKDDPK